LNYPQLPPPQQPGGYNPFNPYQGFDPNADYVPWLPGRQGPRYLPIAIVVGAILLCSCCSFLVGTVFGIELPCLIAPSSCSSDQNQNAPQRQNQNPADTPTQEPFEWRLIYPQVT
jgi:hypothetical protein